MRTERCGYIPEEEREPRDEPLVLGGIETDVCPAWHFTRPDLAVAINDVYEMERAVQLTEDSPAALVDAFSLVRRARITADQDAASRRRAAAAEAARAAAARGDDG